MADSTQAVRASRRVYETDSRQLWANLRLGESTQIPVYRMGVRHEARMRLEQRTRGDGNASAAVRDREGRTSRHAASTRLTSARLARLPALFAAAVAVACLSAWPYVKAHLQSIAVMREIGGQPAPWIARSLTAPVTVKDFSYAIETPTGRQQVRARLYLPPNQPKAPAMVIFHGVHHLGIEEPRLKAFATDRKSTRLNSSHLG